MKPFLVLCDDGCPPELQTENQPSAETARDPQRHVLNHWAAGNGNSGTVHGATLAEDRFINIIFSELIKDPKSEVVSIYKLLNYRLSKNFRNKLEHEVKATKAYTSKHTYSLNQYKLNKDQIEIRYKTTYHEYFSITNKPKTNVSVPLVTD